MLLNLTLKDCNSHYILLMFFSHLLGLPFIISDELINKNDIVNIIDECKCGFIATADEYIVSLLSHLSIQKTQILYYGSLEPQPKVESIIGSKCNEDPISKILTPTNVKPEEIDTALWDYLPHDSKFSDQIHRFKKCISQCKGVSSETLEKVRQETDKRTVLWREGQKDFPMYYSVRERNVKCVMYSTVCTIIESLEKELQPLIKVN